jgi:hypothetical protein
MTDVQGEQEWSRTCAECGTELQSATIDFDKANADRPELRPGEMAAVDFCPNPDCPSHTTTT